MKKLRITLYPKHDLELAWRVRKGRFDHGPEHRTCMRCGGQMRECLEDNALSRAMDVYVCPECGTDEGIRDACGDVLPVSEWYIVKGHYFGEHEAPGVIRLHPACHFKQIFNGQQKQIPGYGGLRPVSEVVYSRSDYDGRKWWTTWHKMQEDVTPVAQAREIDQIMDLLLARPEFQNLWALRRTCQLYAEPTSEPTEFNLYGESPSFYLWLRLITREKDYNLYVHFYDKEASSC